MKKGILVFFLLWATIAVRAQNKEQAAHKVVFQMTTADGAEQKGLINNLNNLKNMWGEDVLIHVVIHGPGIELVMKEKSQFKADLDRLIDRAVVFQACENTLKQKGISKSQILDRVEFVPSGLAEIILRQEQGWTYIKSNF